MGSTPADREPGRAALQELAETSAYGMAVVGPHGVRWANSAAVSILGDRAGDLLMQLVARLIPSRVGTVTIDRPEGPMELEGECAPVDGEWGIWFRDLRAERAQQQHIRTIAAAALGVADSASIDVTLNELARQVRDAAGLAAVQVVTMQGNGPVLRIVGRAGFRDDTDITTRLEDARTRGARLALMDAVRDNTPVIMPGRKAEVMSDPAWAPMHHLFGPVDWDCFGAFPLNVRDRAVGVLLAFFAPGQDPDERAVDFLRAVADQAALAVDYASLLAMSRDEGRRRERERIASDLHDSVVQQVFSMRLLASTLENSCADAEHVDAERVQTTAVELSALCRNTLADLRALIFELRPADLAELGLAESIKVHAQAVEARTGLQVEVIVHPGSAEPSLEACEDLYRIAQEGLHNVVKHADAQHVVVTLAGDQHEVVLTIADDGHGLLEPVEGAHLGLTSMSERARRWGGTFVVHNDDAGGVLVRASIPVPEAGDQVGTSSTGRMETTASLAPGGAT